MAIFHVATNTPPKQELIADWIGKQPWGPAPGSAIELQGSFHLDDPDGEVGMQVFLVGAGRELFHVPLTYRATPLTGGEGSFLGLMEHSVLGPRHVYDGLGDDRFLTVLAGVAVSGYGQALGFANHDGRWYAWAESVRIAGVGSLDAGRIAVDGLVLEQTAAPQPVHEAVFRNDAIEMTVYRRVTDRPAPAVGLTATSPTQPTPIGLVALRQLQ